MIEVIVLEIMLNGITENATKVGMFFMWEFTAPHVSIILSQLNPYSFINAGNIKYKFVNTDKTTLSKLPVIKPITAPFFVL